MSNTVAKETKSFSDLEMAGVKVGIFIGFVATEQERSPMESKGSSTIAEELEGCIYHLKQMVEAIDSAVRFKDFGYYGLNGGCYERK